MVDTASCTRTISEKHTFLFFTSRRRITIAYEFNICRCLHELSPSLPAPHHFPYTSVSHAQAVSAPPFNS